MEKPLHVDGEVATNGDAPESKPATNGDRIAEPKPSTNGTKEEEKPAVNDGTEGWAKPAKKSNAPLPQTFPVPP